MKKINLILISILAIFLNNIVYWINETEIITDYNLYNKINYKFLLFIVIILVFLFFWKPIKEDKIKVIKPISLSVKKNRLIKELNKLLLNTDELEETLFFEKLNYIFRIYFSYIWIKNSDKLTLKDIKKIKIDTTLLALFEKSYIWEFENKTHSSKLKKELIIDFIKLLK